MVGNMSGGGWSTWCRHRSVFHSKVWHFNFSGNRSAVLPSLAISPLIVVLLQAGIPLNGTFEWKTDMCRHHVDQPPPLMLSTIPVHYYCVLPWKMNQRARARIARQSGGQCMLKSFSGFKTSINVISAMNSSCIWSDAERSIITALKYYIIVCNV